MLLAVVFFRDLQYPCKPLLILLASNGELASFQRFDTRMIDWKSAACFVSLPTEAIKTRTQTST